MRARAAREPTTERSKMTPMTATDPTADPLVTKYVEAALDLCRDRMPAEDLEVFRARLYLFYETNPEAVTLLDEIRQEQHAAPVVAGSGERARQDEDALALAAQPKARSVKGGAR